ncbi:hypothetical protein VNI00_009253 [Paramarasmius palmivorus]|uniref:Myb/SANT-like domain-containing protein n=1 Tax=Paramarasmius palmivorus TaxID=297713 RepID=A0AAW0CRT6_9AGAR
MADTQNKENQLPPPAPGPKRRGRPKGSKNKRKEASIAEPITTPSKSTQPSPVTDTPAKTPRLRAVYTDDDDRTLMEVFLEQKTEGNQTSNGGWKSPAITAAVEALKGSEKESGGGPKTASSIRDHYDFLKHEFGIFQILLNKSGWGWNEEKHCIEASNEQWEGLGPGEAHLKAYKGKLFPIYAAMDELLSGALATGSQAFRAGQDDGDSSDSNTESGDNGNEADANPDTSVSTIVSTVQQDKKRKSALDTPVPQKRSRQDRTGKGSTSASLSQMSRAIERVAAAMDTSSDSDEAVLKKAVALVSKVEVFSKAEKAKLLLHLSRDISFATLLLTVDDEETRIEVMRLQLA